MYMKHTRSAHMRSQVQFCLQWAEQMLQSTAPLRRRRPAALCLTATSSTNSSDLCTPANSHIMKLTEHELVDTSLAAREEQAHRPGRRRPSRNLSIPRGRCNYSECPAAAPNYKGPLPKRTHLLCPSCMDGTGAYYHLQCFHAVHRCALTKL